MQKESLKKKGARANLKGRKVFLGVDHCQLSETLGHRAPGTLFLALAVVEEN